MLAAKAGKGWYRNPDRGELLIANVGPPRFDGKLHAFRPPIKRWNAPLPDPDELPPGSKIWCSSWDFTKAYKQAYAKLLVWDGGEECLLAPLCTRCFGKEEARLAAASSSSSSESN